MVMTEYVQEHIETLNTQNNTLRHNLALQPKELDWWKSDFVQDSLKTFNYDHLRLWIIFAMFLLDKKY